MGRRAIGYWLLARGDEAFRNPCATFAQGSWGPRKFVILGESGGTSRLNADVVSSQYDLVAERERYLCARVIGSPPH